MNAAQRSARPRLSQASQQLGRRRNGGAQSSTCHSVVSRPAVSASASASAPLCPHFTPANVPAPVAAASTSTVAASPRRLPSFLPQAIAIAIADARVTRCQHPAGGLAAERLPIPTSASARALPTRRVARRTWPARLRGRPATPSPPRAATLDRLCLSALPGLASSLASPLLRRQRAVSMS